jgi:5-methylcytosine-specific restriction endonuclease McrBC GTP-binding regulatory subunit McrB
MNLKEKIIELSDRLLEHLLNYRKNHPAFRFWLRSRESIRADDKARLKGGQWFQGSNYIFLSFYSASGHVNMTRSIGWVVTFDGELMPRMNLTIVWPKEKDQRKIELYQDLIKQLGGFRAITQTEYSKDLQGKDPFISLQDFLDNTYPKINEIIENHGLTEVFTIPESKFQEKLNKVLFHRSNLYGSNNENKPIIMNSVKSPLNLILYGPPGTGKTYHTIDRAMKIVAPNIFEQYRNDRKRLTEKFRELLITDWQNINGQISFITFHQSMSYEDFIEGIKPVKPEKTNVVEYSIEDGIFKNICKLANRKENFTVKIDGIIKPLTKELFEELYYGFSEPLPLYDKENSDIKLKTKEGYQFELFKNTVDSIVVKAGQKKTNTAISFNELNLVLFEDKLPTYKSYEQIIIEKILEGKEFNKSSEDNSSKNFVLIIDEINRGNVSQIFGELITLMEEGKRATKSEQLSAMLTYSKKQFTVPPNLYIIGTMNTADRSIEALDTALRRRFHFEEILPDAELIQELFEEEFLQKCADLDQLDWEDDEWKKVEEKYIDVIPRKQYERFKDLVGREGGPPQQLSFYRQKWYEADIEIVTVTILKKINSRIHLLLNRDHLIGHSYFIGQYTWDKIQTVFYCNIIPLLQEYFYGDYGKMGLILGKGFIRKVEVEQEEEIFANFNYEADQYNGKDIYELVEYRSPDQEEFIEIDEEAEEIDFKEAIGLLLNQDIDK